MFIKKEKMKNNNNFIKKIVTSQNPYFIAEIGSNHNGSMVLARELIESAKRSGADCVKFQSFSKTSIFSKKCRPYFKKR